MVEVSSREFNKDVSAAKRAASQGPVIVTDRGRPSHVLLSIRDYRRLLGDERSIVDWLSADDGLELQLDPVEINLQAPEL